MVVNISHFKWCLYSLICLSLFLQYSTGVSLAESRFDERLIVKSLSKGKVYTYFEFRTFIPAQINQPYQINNDKGVDLFPSSIYRLFDQNAVQELSLSFAFGSWRFDMSGVPFRDTAPNAHLAVWFDQSNDNFKSLDYHWEHLTSDLSGLFCSSIDTIDSTVTIQPRVAYRPLFFNPNLTNNSGLLAALPKEAVCKENLEPWLNLLPCGHKYGLSKLLTSPKLFDSEYLSIALDFRYSCSNILMCSQTTGLELRQTIQKVFDSPLTLDGRYSWTLRNLFGASLTSHCPLARTSDVYIDMSSIITKNLLNIPQLKIKPDDYVHLTHNRDTNEVYLKINQSFDNSKDTKDNNAQLVYAHYDLKKQFLRTSNVTIEQQPGNIGLTHVHDSNDLIKFSIQKVRSPIEVSRGHSFTGVRTGSLSVTITNNLNEDLDVIYLDMLPWYIRIYIHQIQIKSRKLEKLADKSRPVQPKQLYYLPSKDRTLPHQLEILMTVPANSLVTVEIECINQYLLWTEFPPDANQGLFINSASVTVFNHNQTFGFERNVPFIFNDFLNLKGSTAANSIITERLELYKKFNVFHIYTDSIQIPMASPDFSMPYNVICLVSTVLSIAFGPIFNITNRRPKLLNPGVSVEKDNKQTEEDAKTENKN